MNSSALQFRSYLPPRRTLQRKWYVVDAQDQVLGRLCSGIAALLMGKGKPIYTHAMDCGDFVIAVNAQSVRLTGNKLEGKINFYHTGHPGGARLTPYKKLLQEKPERAIYLAVRRMLPKNKIGARQIVRLKIYRGGSHPHAVQKPETVTFSANGNGNGH